ncbi:sialate O-acetylesterase [soil metagenome]
MNIRILTALATICLLSACAPFAVAKVKAPSIFSDHMVLQTGMPLPVWGTADADEKVSVSIAGQTKSTQAGADGKWIVTLDPLKSDKPLTLTIKGENTITANDVLIGEVWLCSGQSNMVLPLTKVNDYEQEKAAAKYPNIRMFTTKWVICSPETVSSFSAVAYFFSREIHQKTGMPVGAINRAAGGSPIEMWTNLDVQKQVPELKPILDAFDAPKPESKDAAQAEIDKKQAVEVEGKNAVAAQKRPLGYLFEDRIAPLVPYAIRGAVWYQGEANSYTVNANLYGRQLSLMIGDWRKRWGYDFAFLTVQLPDFGGTQKEPVEESGRAWVRDGVLQSLSLPNTGMAVTLGTGEEKNNHPKNKQEVGRRLGMWALNTQYGKKDIAASGPIPTRHKIVDGKIVIRFAHTDGGLIAKDGPLKGVAIAGDDHKWVWADSKIDGDTLTVWSTEVKSPAAVRYAWAGNPAGCNLFNGAGLPATPFRTDDWPPTK